MKCRRTILALRCNRMYCHGETAVKILVRSVCPARPPARTENAGQLSMKLNATRSPRRSPTARTPVRLHAPSSGCIMSMHDTARRRYSLTRMYTSLPFHFFSVVGAAAERGRGRPREESLIRPRSSSSAVLQRLSSPFLVRSAFATPRAPAAAGARRQPRSGFIHTPRRPGLLRSLESVLSRS